MPAPSIEAPAPEPVPEVQEAEAPKPSPPKSFVDFGGHEPTLVEKESVVAFIGGAKNSNFVFSVIGSAQAALPTAPACADDRARGTVKPKVTAPDARIKIDATEYMPGMYDVVWSATVNGHFIALDKVAVRRDPTEALREPNVAVFRDFAKRKDKAAAKPTYNAKTTVDVFEGKKAFLYRVYLEPDAPAICADIAMPYSGAFEALAGKLYYRDMKNNIRVADFTPKMISTKAP